MFEGLSTEQVYGDRQPLTGDTNEITYVQKPCVLCHMFEECNSMWMMPMWTIARLGYPIVLSLEYSSVLCPLALKLPVYSFL